MATITPDHITVTTERTLVRNPKIVALTDDMTTADRLAAVKANRGEPGMVFTTQYRAAYEPAGNRGPAAFGYGATEDAAIADLAAEMQFNLDHYGNLVG